MSFRSYIPAIVMFLIGGVFAILGTLFKILHWGMGPINAPYLLAFGALLAVTGICIAIIQLIMHYHQKNN